MVRNAFERADDIHRAAMEGADNSSGNTEGGVQFPNVAESSASSEGMQMSTESSEEIEEEEADDIYEDAFEDLEAEFPDPSSSDSDKQSSLAALSSSVLCSFSI